MEKEEIPKEFSRDYWKFKKLGLVWEKQEESASELLQDKIPIFREVEEKEILPKSNHGSDDGEKLGDFSIKNHEIGRNPVHFLLEGENLHSLDLLLRTHSGKVDIIYIDPPYNTGNRDFFFEDDFVAKEDQFRHSKWLSFMEKRLILAKQLLSPQGILFVSIGDQEQAQLTLLLHEIFGEHHFLMTLPRITTKSGKSSDVFSKNHDYVLMYTRRHRDMLVMEEYEDAHYTQSDEFQELRGNYRVNQTLDYNSLSYSSALDYPITLEGRTFYPGGDEEAYFARQRGEHLRTDWAWRWSEELFRFGLEQGFIVLWEKQDGTARIYTKTYEKAKIIFNKKTNSYEITYVEGKTKAFSSLSLIENQYSNTNGKKDLKKFQLEHGFDYPKPVALMKKLFRCHQKKDALILDFFAGTGTTGQAVLELNQEDGGTRSFILCTDHQNDICQKVTYPRLAQIMGKYSYEEEVREELYRSRISIGLLTDRKKLDAVMRKCDLEKKRHQDQYEIISKVIEDDCLLLVGKKNVLVTGGLQGHLKYYQVDYVSRKVYQDFSSSMEDEEIPPLFQENTVHSLNSLENNDKSEETLTPEMEKILSLEKKVEAIEDEAKRVAMLEQLEQIKITLSSTFLGDILLDSPNFTKSGEGFKEDAHEDFGEDDQEEEVRRLKILSSVKELIQLEHGVAMRDGNYIICSTEEELDVFFGDESQISRCKGLYLEDSVLLFGKQKSLLMKNKVPIWRVPSCYYWEEERGIF